MSKDLENKIVGADLCKLAELLTRYNLCDDTTSLENAGQSCISLSKDSFWSYKLNKIAFRVDEVGGRIPMEAEDIFVSLSVKITGSRPSLNSLTDPLTELFFDIELEAFRANEATQDIDSLYASWHLDKHNLEGNKTKYSHPLYHFTFGGNKMECKGDIFGNCIILPSPRLVYPPMDAVLGIDFILQNYLHKDKIEKIQQESEYVEIVKSAQERLWKPFFSSIYSHWNSVELSLSPNFNGYKLFPLLY